MSESESQISERFDAIEHRGQLVEAEHLVRFRFAARLAAGRRVLDAACGTAYGTRMLAEAGAAEVVGVDIAEAVLDAMRPGMPAQVDLRAGDVTSLDLPDDRFDLVVCFEAIEHLDEADQERALDELARVLVPGGVLAISSPNRDVYNPGNPHHLHEYTPVEFTGALRRRFANVTLLRQHNWIASAIFDDETSADDRANDVEGVHFSKVVAVEPGRESFTLALASDGPTPAMNPEMVATSTVEVRWWIEKWEEQHAALQELRERAEDARLDARRVVELREQLALSEVEAACVPDLERERARTADTADTIWRELEIARDELRTRRAELAAAGRDLAALKGSRSWKLTGPMRRAGRLLRRSRRER
jgi:ubiquinone/menaquinone biosynthesis C-methylase UbiE